MKECSQLSCMYNTLKGCVVDEHFGICPLSNTRLPDVPVTDVVKTNADHIRSMTDDELAEFIEDVFETGRISVFAIYPELTKNRYGADWLKQPYKEDT